MKKQLHTITDAKNTINGNKESTGELHLLLLKEIDPVTQKTGALHVCRCTAAHCEIKRYEIISKATAS